MRTFACLVLTMCGALLGASMPAAAGVSVSVGFSIRSYPDLLVVPGYPVYYAPGLDANYFFYDGLYWVYADDRWYSSFWYDGPWDYAAPEFVPYFVLRVPVRYYRRPPSYFRGWLATAPPRWGDHWGHAWELRRAGWDTWDRAAVPRAAPLPVYQRGFVGDRYPSPDQQRALVVQHYSYRPVDTLVRAKFAPQPARPARVVAPPARMAAPHPTFDDNTARVTTSRVITSPVSTPRPAASVNALPRAAPSASRVESPSRQERAPQARETARDKRETSPSSQERQSSKHQPQDNHQGDR